MRLTTETKNYYENAINFYEEWYDAPSFIWKKHKNCGYPSHFHSALEIYFVLKGNMVALINGQKYRFGEGEICVINPYDLHSFDCNEEDVAVLIISNYFLSDFQSEYENKHLPIRLEDKDYNQHLYALLDELPSSFYDNTTLSVLGKKGMTDLIIDKIITRYGILDEKNNKEVIANCLKYLHTNYKDKITLETLAAEFGYTKNSMSRLLRKHLSVDLRIFLNNLRAEQVKLLLNHPNYKHLSVLHIAYACGFDSPATFYRTYKRNYGELPKKRK